MSEKHLGDAVAAVADGHLAGGARDRALTHMASCAQCRSQVEHHRAMRARLAALEVPAPPVGVTARLLALAPQGLAVPVAPHRRPLPDRSTTPIPLARPAVDAFYRARLHGGQPPARQGWTGQPPPGERPPGRLRPGESRPGLALHGQAAEQRGGRRRVVAAGVLAAAALGGGATLGMRSGGLRTGRSGPVITPGSVELSRFTEMSRSVVMDDPAPALTAASNH